MQSHASYTNRGKKWWWKTSLKKIKTRIDFELNQNWIYYLYVGKRRLYVFSLLIKTVFI